MGHMKLVTTTFLDDCTVIHSFSVGELTETCNVNTAHIKPSALYTQNLPPSYY